jgi:hypothetical protein
MSMKISRPLVASAVVLSAAVGITLSAPAFAHHSLANYDREKEVTLTGTVLDFQLKNPHAQITFEVKGTDGTAVKWTAGTSSPMRLFRMGWKTTTLKPGDQITVTGGPHRGGKPEIWLNKLVGPNGEQPVPQGAE